MSNAISILLLVFVGSACDAKRSDVPDPAAPIASALKVHDALCATSFEGKTLFGSGQCERIVVQFFKDKPSARVHFLVPVASETESASFKGSTERILIVYSE